MNTGLRQVKRVALATAVLVVLSSGTAFAAGKLITGADIVDDSVTGADVAESSLGKVPNAGNADKLGGLAASMFLGSGSLAGGALEGTYPNPDIAADAVTTAQIKNQTVGMADLAPGAQCAAPPTQHRDAPQRLRRTATASS